MKSTFWCEMCHGERDSVLFCTKRVGLLRKDLEFKNSYVKTQRGECKKGEQAKLIRAVNHCVLGKK